MGNVFLVSLFIKRRKHHNQVGEEHYTDFWGTGMYKCKKCGTQLFESGAKFKSGTIWPSFRKAIKGNVSTRPDDSHGMHRTEVLCTKCGEHLGHVFDDGKIVGDTHSEAGQRYCVLSDALDFKEDE